MEFLVQMNRVNLDPLGQPTWVLVWITLAQLSRRVNHSVLVVFLHVVWPDPDQHVGLHALESSKVRLYTCQAREDIYIVLNFTIAPTDMYIILSHLSSMIGSNQKKWTGYWVSPGSYGPWLCVSWRASPLFLMKTVQLFLNQNLKNRKNFTSLVWWLFRGPFLKLFMVVLLLRIMPRMFLRLLGRSSRSLTKLRLLICWTYF